MNRNISGKAVTNATNVIVEVGPAVLSLSLLMALALSACGGLSPEEVDAQAEQIALPLIATWKAEVPTPTVRPTRTPPPPTILPTPAPALPDADLAAAQVLNLAECCSGSDFYTLDPVEVWGGGSAQILAQAFVGLTRQDEETADVGPGMAVSWDISADKLVWTFQLRPDVPWVYYNPATGRVEQVTDEGGQVRYVSAYDFEYGLKRALDPDTLGAARSLYMIEGAEDFHEGDGAVGEVGVEALDDAALEIRLREPAGYFDVVATSLASVAQPRWQIEAHDEEWTETGNFQGYGPYVLKEWVHDSHLTLVENPHWPGTEGIPRPTIEEITWMLMDDADALLAAYQAGDFDVIQVPPENLDAVQADSQLQEHLVVQPEPFVYYYGFNTVEAPFDDPRVRRAFSLAVDRQALVDEVVPGNHRPARWFSPPGPRAVPTAEQYPSLGIAYDPDEAIELLDSVYPDRAQMPSVSLASMSYGARSEIAEAVRLMWKETLGVDVNVEFFENFGDYLDHLDEDAPQMWEMGLYPEYADAHYFLGEVFHSGTDVQYTHWSNGVFDDLVDQAARSTDTEERMGWYAEAEDILVNQDAVVVPLYWRAEGILTQPYIYRTYSQIGMFGLIEHFETWAVLER